ncbi:MAG: sulfatase [Thermoleophilaceae bacterium]
MGAELTRRGLIRAGGAGAAGLTLLGATGASRQQAPAGAMNVVVVVMDSLRVDHVYGRRARTPAMDRVAREGLRFTRAYPEGMPTIPARRAIMAGRRTFPFRGWRPYRGLPAHPGWEPVGSDGKMWTEVLREQGWTTGYVTDNPHLLLGIHRPFRRTFDRVELVDGQLPLRRRPGRRVSRAEVRRHLPPALRGSSAEPRMAAYLAANPRDRREEDYLAARVFRNGMNWIEWARARQPFALVIDTFDAHEPWDAPRRLRDIYGRPGARIEPIQPFPTPAAKHRSLDLSRGLLRRMRQLYAAEVTLVDAWLGRFLDRLADLGLAENTLLVLLSDHGVLLGEYGWVGKRYSEIHDELSHVPFLIRHPQGKAAGRSSRYFASTHDVGPTVLSALGQEPTARMDGVDLTPLLDGRPPRRERPYRVAAYKDYVAASDGRWLLISDNRGRDKRLYRIGGERRNVARRHPGQVGRLWRRLEREAGRKGLPRFN